MKTTTKAWAIDTGDAQGLIGSMWFAEVRLLSEIPDAFMGNLTALFATRSSAKDALLSVKGSREQGKFPHAKVVRVLVSIETVEAP